MAVNIRGDDSITHEGDEVVHLVSKKKFRHSSMSLSMYFRSSRTYKIIGIMRLNRWSSIEHIFTKFMKLIKPDIISAQITLFYLFDTLTTFKYFLESFSSETTVCSKLFRCYNSALWWMIYHQDNYAVCCVVCERIILKYTSQVLIAQNRLWRIVHV